MESATKSASGVQELIDRIRDQGIQAATRQADQILSEARAKAAEIVAQAKAESEALSLKSRAETDAYQKASLEALQLAARDAVLGLKSKVIARFEEFVKRLVVKATREEEVVRDIVLVIAGHTAEAYLKDKQIQVRISQALLKGEASLREEAKHTILGLSSDMLREGVELVSDSEVQGGARVRLINEKLEIDLSDRAVSRLIAQRILPRFRAILEGAE